MNATHLLAHFDRLAEAPNAVPRLRRFILDLAVRGKLVPQEAGEEPAGELLRRIQTEKSRLVQQRLVQAEKPLQPITEVEKRLALPKGWAWVRLASLAHLVTSGSRDWAKFYSDEGPIFVRMGNLSRDSYRLRMSNVQRVKPPNDGEGKRTRLEGGDILISITGEVGLLGLIPSDFGEAYINQHTCMVRPSRQLSSRYLPELFRSSFAQDQFNAPQRGLKNSFRLTDVTEFVVPLPPLAEQHRIVAKVDELMALCDQLEAAQQDRERRRDRLAAASLQRLNQPAADTSPATQREHARFHLHYLPRLATRPENIKALRLTILNLAVQGRLVNQDADDESAVVLLDGINKARAALVASKKLRSAKPFLPVEVHELPFCLPGGWVLNRLGEIYDVRDGTHDTPKYVEAGFPLITSKNLSSGRLTFQDIKLISEADHRQISERSGVAKGDVLLAMIGSIGNPVIVDTDRPFSIKNVALFKYFDVRLSSPRFLCLYLQHAADGMRELATGGLQPFVSLGFLRNYPLALPPLAEQHRIVAKVDALLALCDQLETQLSTTQTNSRRLLEAVLEAALAPA